MLIATSSLKLWINDGIENEFSKKMSVCDNSDGSPKKYSASDRWEWVHGVDECW